MGSDAFWFVIHRSPSDHQGGQGHDGGDQKGGHCHNATRRWRHFFTPGWWSGDGENDEKVDTVVDGMDRAIR